MQNNHPKRAENYTDAFLWTLWLILFMGFFLMTALIGILWTLGAAFVLNRAITVLWRYRNR